jgi:hypothetical protein
MRWSLLKKGDRQAPSSVLRRPLGYLSVNLHRAVIIVLQRQGHAL